MVGERLLQHLVHHLDVPGHGEAVLVGRDPSYDDAVADLAEDVEVLGAAGHVHPGPHVPVAGRLEPAALVGVLGVGAGVELGLVEVAQPGGLAGGLAGPGQQERGDLVAVLERLRAVPVAARTGGARGHGELDAGATRGAVVHGHPPEQAPVGVLDEQLAAGPRPGAGHGGRDGPRVDARAVAHGRVVGCDQRGQAADVRLGRLARRHRGGERGKGGVVDGRGGHAVIVADAAAPVSQAAVEVSIRAMRRASCGRASCRPTVQPARRAASAKSRSWRTP